MKESIKSALIEIAGEEYVSTFEEELYFYGRDPGLSFPSNPHYVVLPENTEEIQQIVRLANKEGIPIVPLGAGLSLTGLAIPRRGGIVIDMKRMDRILEVNEKARFVIVEGGTSQGKLQAYLEKHYPRLRHSIPDAPPTATIAANVVIHGQGRLSQQYGFNSDLVAGMEVVLPSGEICKVGSCAVSPYWFSKGPPLPDISGLFLGWFGTTGIITKLAIKLYPRKKMRDLEIFVTDNENLISDIIYEVTHTEMVEDITIFAQPWPLFFKDNSHICIYFTGDTEEELEFKRRVIWKALEKFIESKEGGFMWVQPSMKPTFLDMPQRSVARFADVKRGGGFEYSGPILLVEKYPECMRKLRELSTKYNLAYSAMARIIDTAHCMMFAFAFAFNRADEDMVERARRAMAEVSKFIIEVGGVFWKPTVEEQKLTIEHIDSGTLKLLKMIKNHLDPNNIMNPSNWELR